MALVVAGVVLGLVPVVAFLMRDRPEDVGLRAYGEEPGTKVDDAGSPAIRCASAFSGLRLGLRTRDFYLLAGTFFVCGASTNGLIGTHLIPACIDNGIPEVAAASLLASMAIFNFVGATGSGWLSDRVDCRKLLCMYYALRGVSLLILPFSFDTFYGLSLFTAFYGLDWIATVPPTVRLTTQAFGREKTGIMYGWITCAHQIGGAMAAFFGGVLRVNFDTYMHAFMLSGMLCFLAAIMVLFIGYNRRARTARRAGARPRPELQSKGQSNAQTRNSPAASPSSPAPGATSAAASRSRWPTPARRWWSMRGPTAPRPRRSRARSRPRAARRWPLSPMSPTSRRWRRWSPPRSSASAASISWSTTRRCGPSSRSRRCRSRSGGRSSASCSTAPSSA